ncbi:MAG: hypothetical protein ACP5N9_01325 [Candidatus Bilamarchaeum sp.]|jgi:hypothetical protein
MESIYLVRGNYRDADGGRNVVGILCTPAPPSRNVLRKLGFPSACSVDAIEVTKAPTQPVFFHFDSAPSPNRKVREVTISNDGQMTGTPKIHQFDLLAVLPTMPEASFARHFGSHVGIKTQPSTPSTPLSRGQKRTLRS